MQDDMQPPASANSTDQAAIQQRLATLDRRVRWLAAGNALLIGALALLFVTGTRSPAQQTLEVQRLNIVEPDGTLRLAISNAAQFPPPRVGGKELKRAVAPAGLVFYDGKGNEVGGIAMTDAAQGKISALALDYPNYDAIGLLTRTDADNHTAVAGLQINSHPPASLDVLQASKVVQRRIAIENDNEDARVLLADPQGRERIRIGVDHDGVARFEMLDADGKVTFRAPAQQD